MQCENEADECQEAEHKNNHPPTVVFAFFRGNPQADKIGEDFFHAAFFISHPVVKNKNPRLLFRSAGFINFRASLKSQITSTK